MVYWRYFYHQMSDCIRGNKNTSNICKQILFFLALIFGFWIFIVLYTIVIFVFYYGIISTLLFYCEIFKDNIYRFESNYRSKCEKLFLLVFWLVLYNLLFPLTFILCFFAQMIDNCRYFKERPYVYYNYWMQK